jgi:hypothetical protein
MPKIREKLRKYRVKVDPYQSNRADAAEESVTLPDSSSNNNEEESKGALSRGQRKRQQKKDKIKVKLGLKPFGSNVAKKSTTPSEELMSELEKAIARTEDTDGDVVKPSATTITSNKLKQKVAVREAAR